GTTFASASASTLSESVDGAQAGRLVPGDADVVQFTGPFSGTYLLRPIPRGLQLALFDVNGNPIGLEPIRHAGNPNADATLRFEVQAGRHYFLKVTSGSPLAYEFQFSP